ncbi:MAG: ABC transporter permease subunit [Myxococcales bacterium]|nr:ABC transporter permease subunit [Myxococcales bacterium]
MAASVVDRILGLAQNTFREAARDRVPLALFGAGLGIGVTSLLVAAMSLGRDRSEVVAVLTTASLSLFSLIGAIVLGATLLYKDLERRTVFPILARPIRRGELLIGKHVGIVATIATFAFLEGALALTLTALSRDDVPMARALGGWGVAFLVSAAVLVRARDRSTPLLVLAPLLFALQFALVGPLGDLRNLVLASVVLAVLEATIVAAVSLVFGAFSSPFLTALCTTGIVLIGRNADLLAKLPERTFGPTLVAVGRGLARVVPNLHIYVPPRIVLSGHAGGSLGGYLGEAAAYGLLYAVVLLVVSTLIFRRRDFA